MSTQVATLAAPRKSVIQALADRYGMDAKPFEATLRATVMPSQHTVEEFAACLLVAKEHDLNPVTREIYFMRTKAGGIQPIVSVDGWAKKCNTHPQFDGMEFTDHMDGKKLVAITCRIYRKDRARCTEVTEYMDECRGTSPAWQKTPSRMLRHRAMIQAARYAFGFAGIMEPDEFDQWQQPRDVTPKAAPLPEIPDDIPELTSEPVRVPDELPEVPDDVPVITDPDAFLEELSFDLGLCDSLEDLERIKASNAKAVDALPKEYQRKAQALYANAAGD